MYKMMSLSAILNNHQRTSSEYESNDGVNNHPHQECMSDGDQNIVPHEPERGAVKRRSKTDPIVQQLFVDHVERTGCPVHQAAVTFDLKYSTAIAIL